MALARQGNDLVARVVAWHNRHPLARRITPAQVVSMGLVCVPFVVPPGRALVARNEVRDAAPAEQAATEGSASDRDASADAADPHDGSGQASPTDTASDATPANEARAESNDATHANDAADAPLEAEAALTPEAAGGRLRERAEARSRAQAQGRTQASMGAAGAPRRSAPAGRAPTAAEARLRKKWRAAFTEDLLDPSSPGAVARFALAHGAEEHPGPVEAPVRELMVSSPVATRGASVARLWLYTAAIDVGARRVRVLVAPGDGRRVLGPRLMARGRLGVAGALMGSALTALALWAPVGQGSRGPGGAAGAMAMAPRPAEVASSAGPSSAGAVALASVAAETASAPPALPASPSSAASAAPDSAVRSPTPDAPAAMRGAASTAAAPPPRPAAPNREDARPMRHVVPFLSEEVRQAAREASEALRAERAERAQRAGAGAGAGAAVTTGAAEQTAVPQRSAAAGAAPAGPAMAAPTTATAAAPPAPATAWAVSTRNLRTRFESEQMLAALRDVAYRHGHGSELKLEVLPAGEDWRAVGWPLASRADAERLRQALAARGLKAEVVQF